MKSKFTTMKKHLIGIFLLSFSLNFLIAQNETKQTEFIGGNSATYTTGFGGIIFQTSFIDGTPVGFFGGGGAAQFNNSFYFGGFGLGMQNDLRVKNDNLSNNLPAEGELTMGMGGVMLGFMPMGHKKIHPIIGLDFTWGGYSISDVNSGLDFFDGSFVGVTPRAGIEANALPWLKVNAGLGYRVYTGIENDYINSSFLNAPLIDFRLMFGWFGE